MMVAKLEVSGILDWAKDTAVTVASICKNGLGQAITTFKGSQSFLMDLSVF